MDGDQVGPAEKVTETTGKGRCLIGPTVLVYKMPSLCSDPPLVTGLSVTPSDDSVTVEAEPAEEVDSIK